MQCWNNDNTQASETAILDIQNLTLNYKGQNQNVRVLDNFSLVAKAGRITALVGESGCGKSTAALATMGIQDRNAIVSGGKICIAGTDILTLPKANQRSYISNHAGIIFQDPMDSLNPLLTIGDQLTETIRIHRKMKKKHALSVAIKQLQAVSLPQPEEVVKKYPFMLSGGMCQRVMIAIASISHPPLLIADEPTTALDVTVQAQILKLLSTLPRKKGSAVLLITHDLGSSQR